MDEYQVEEPASGDPCFYYEIPGGLLDKDVIEITGYFCGEKILIEVLANKYVRDGENIALPLQFTLTSDGKWNAMTFSETVSRQEQSGITAPAVNFQIRIVALDSAFEIHLNGTKLCTQKHLIPLSQATHISMDGEAEFTGVEFKDLCSENETSIRSPNSLSEKNQYSSVPEVVPGFTRLSENRRSSNRQPKPPTVVPTRASIRSKPALATTREELTVQSNTEIDQPLIRSTVSAEPVKASVDPSNNLYAAVPSTGSNLSLSGKYSSGRHSAAHDSKHKSLREKLHLKKGSKTSVSSAVHEENQYANSGSLEDVWVEEGGRELSADGTGAFVVTGAASVPNLNTQPEKDKKRFSFYRGGKKSRSTSSPPPEVSTRTEEKDKKKHHLGGIHIGKGSKKGEKEAKSEKSSKKKSPFGRKHTDKESKQGLSKNVVVAGSGEFLVTETNITGEYANPDPLLVNEKPTLIELASRRSKTSTSTPSHTSPRGTLIGSHVRGSYDLEEAQRSFDIQHGTYQRMPSEAVLVTTSQSILHSSPNRSPGRRGEASGSRSPSVMSVTTPNSLNSGVVVIEDHEKRKKKNKSTKIKGDSPEIAAQLMDGSARNRNSVETLTYTYANLDIPLHLVSRGEVAMVEMTEEHTTKEKDGKIKGESAEIADNLLGAKRGMSNEFMGYTGTHTTVPLKLTQEDLLSTGGKSFMPIIGSRGSYNLETAPSSLTGTYQTRPEEDWNNEAFIVQGSASGVQYSKPPEKPNIQESVLVSTVPTVSKKEKKNLLKGEAAEIASNLVDEEGQRAHGRIYNGGNPLCGENGVNVPWRLNSSNRNAQPVPYGRIGTGRSHSMSSNSFNSLEALGPVSGDGFAISAAHEAEVHAAAPYPGEASFYSTKSATMPASASGSIAASGPGMSGTLPSAGVVAIRDKEKKHPKNHEGDEKLRKRDRMSGFFRRIFRRKRKSGTSQSDWEEIGVSEGVGTEYEMTEQRSSSQLSLDTDDYDETKFSVTAKPSETCRYASQLHGDLPAMKSNFPLGSLCDSRTFVHPLRLSAADIPTDISSVGANYVSSAPLVPLQRTNLSGSWSSLSPGGSRRLYHRSSRHRPESASSWSSISPGGTRRHRHRTTRLRTDSVSTWSSVSPGGSRRHYHRSSRHRPESVSSWSSISPGGTHRHRKRTVKHRTDSMSSWDSVSSGGTRRHYRRSNRHRYDSLSSWSSISPGGTRRHHRRSPINLNHDSLRSSTRDHEVSAIKVEQQIPAYAAPPMNNRDQPFNSYFNLQKQETAGVFASQPRPDSVASSNSSISSLYGRVVVVGQSPDFRMRIQSFRKRMSMPKKPKGPKGSRRKGENGYDSDSSDSSISSIASDKLPPTVVKVRGGEYAIFEDASETIFEDRPRKIEDTYANYSKY